MKLITRRNFVKSAAISPLGLSASRSFAQSNNTFDVVVAGAGHNSLITAGYLVKAGFNVLVLEGRPTIGGGCKTHEVCLPGFKSDLCSSVHGGIQSNPVLRNNELNLFDYGLEYIDPDPIMHYQAVDGQSITVWQDEERTYREYAKLSQKDADTFKEVLRQYRNYRSGLVGGSYGPSQEVWDRRFAMSGYDLVRELFEDQRVRSFHLAVGHFGATPASIPGTGNQAFTAFGHQIGGRLMPRGGSGVLTQILGRMIEDHGGTILTNMPVSELIIESGRCTGVVCQDGTKFYGSRAVVSTIHVKHLVNMAPTELWGEDFVSGVDLLRPEHAMFAFHYALSEAPAYPLADGGSIAPSESALLESPERILRLNFDEGRGEVNVDGMPLQIVCPSIDDPDRAPKGYHTLKLEGTLPYALKEGPQHWDVIKQSVADKVLDYFRAFAPNITNDKILAEFHQSPLDIERMNPAMWRGSVHALAYGPAQSGSNRPVSGWDNYRMPISGLYQTGGCTAPGGSITGRPGRNCAAVLLEDLGTSIDELLG